MSSNRLDAAYTSLGATAVDAATLALSLAAVFLAARVGRRLDRTAPPLRD